MTKRKKSKGKKKSGKSKEPKKPLSRAARERAEKLAEEEAARLAEEERQRAEEERRQIVEKERHEAAEYVIRLPQLEQCDELIAQMRKIRAGHDLETAADEQWQQYLECSRLPDALSTTAMNTYLDQWTDELRTANVPETAQKRIADVLQLLERLNEELETGGVVLNESQRQNLFWIRTMFRTMLQYTLDSTTYHLLRNIDKNLRRIDIPTAEYHFRNSDFTICLWLRYQLPTPLPNPRRPPKPRIDLELPALNRMEVLFPWGLDCEKKVVRIMYLSYDHVSDQCSTFGVPTQAVPPPYGTDPSLLAVMRFEFRRKLLYKYEKSTMAASGPIDPLGDDEIPTVPYQKLVPSPSEFLLKLEDDSWIHTIDELSYKAHLDDGILNLRQFSIIGGVYTFELVDQPPQPQTFITMDVNLTTLQLPKQLEFAHMYLEYHPSVVSDLEPGTPEAIEAELKQFEEDMEKLIAIKVYWPQNVVFFEVPLVCHWDHLALNWTRRDVFNLKHNEEKQYLSFHTGRFGTFALATNSHVNMPFQTWDLQPESNGTVTLQLTAAIITLEFNVRNQMIALTQIQNCPNLKASHHLLDVYFKLPKLIKELKRIGISVFPDADVFCYLQSGTFCAKFWPMEHHLYYTMALLSTTFAFQWSRWNLTVGTTRKCIFQMREYDPTSQTKNYTTVVITPEKAVLVDCTEVSTEFSEIPLEHMKFFADLYQLVKSTGTITLKNRIRSTDLSQVYTVAELLIATRILSLS